MEELERHQRHHADEPALRARERYAHGAFDLPPGERGEADGERRDANRQADGLGSWQVQQRRQRRLADEEDLCEAPFRRFHLHQSTREAFVIPS
jgi:hypothetical protein